MGNSRVIAHALLALALTFAYPSVRVFAQTQQTPAAGAPPAADTSQPAGSPAPTAAPSSPSNAAPSAPAPAPAAGDASAPAGDAAPPATTAAPGPADGAPAADQGSQPASAPPTTASPSPSTLPQDLSPWGMFKQADIVVKAVMIGLAFASLVTWTVWFAKGVELAGAKRRARSATRKLQRADNLKAARDEINAGWTRKGIVADLVHAAEREAERSSQLSGEGIKERLSIALARIEARAGRDMARGTGLLATIGATAPFVGLFGTVWGIMNSFIGISQTKTTNLAVVAPGIAEALLATAIGLVAAIPAVIIYNVFARAIAGYRALLSDASGEILQHVSRDLERQERGVGAPPSEQAHLRPAAE